MMRRGFPRALEVYRAGKAWKAGAWLTVRDATAESFLAGGEYSVGAQATSPPSGVDLWEAFKDAAPLVGTARAYDKATSAGCL